MSLQDAPNRLPATRAEVKEAGTWKAIIDTSIAYEQLSF